MTPDALAELHGRAFDDMPPPWSARDFAGLLDDPAIMLVCQPAGFALGRCIGPDAELLTLAVAPEARRRGHGRALLRTFEADALARGAARIFLEVAEANPAAQALYLGHGYRVVGRRPKYYARPASGPVDALVLTKTLDGPHAATGPAKTI